MSEQFYIVDVRKDWRGDPFVTVWRPKNNGYAYPLSWAGKYDRATVDANAKYYYRIRYGTKRTLERFPVPCHAVERLAVETPKGRVDGDAGPVLPNTAAVRTALKRARYIPIEERSNGK